MGEHQVSRDNRVADLGRRDQSKPALFYRSAGGNCPFLRPSCRQKPLFGHTMPVLNLVAERVMSQQENTSPADAMLLLSSTCPHCPKVLEALAQMVKQGQIGALEVINIAAHPERAQQLGVRSVPWFRIGPLQFEGLHSPEELQRWAQKANTRGGQGDYIEQLLSSGALARAIDFVGQDKSHWRVLIYLL